MAFRTIVIKNRCKLEYSLNYLICRGQEEKRILIDEIEFLIIQNTMVSLTCSLLSALIEKKVKVIFCDTKNNPQAELVPYYNNYSTYKKIIKQINFTQETKGYLWTRIIYEKIKNESRLLKKVKNENYLKLDEYCHCIEFDDKTNREGHSAKIYFNSLFGKTFCRDDDFNVINRYLNYGYSIIVSAINREIKICGYLTELGIHHIGETNQFNLSYDLVEPLRSLVDSYAALKLVNEENYKDIFVKMLSSQVIWDGKKIYLDNAIHYYVQSAFAALNEDDISKIIFIEYEL